ncbi:MAG TPA: tetratricopeptide repeat protein [Elusimicrobiota bacterium]|nr:tetratricopeptide repeat protein [Elusimicrobiota bacterium]
MAPLANPLSALERSDTPWNLAESFLEAGETAAVEKFHARLEGPKKLDTARRVASLLELYRGNYGPARDRLREISGQDEWCLSRGKYLDGLLAASDDFVETGSEHFRIRTSPNDAFLAEYVQRALENSHSKMAEVFHLEPSSGVVVEIYPTETRFSRASTLSPETLERSGAIGICKFRRLMVLSPQATPMGYRWLDALSHEYVHFLINEISGTLCPLWLHEGVARYYETAWRRAGPFEHTPAAETQLARAAQKQPDDPSALVRFQRMEPSMVYLDNQEQVSLAFTEVSDAVAYLLEEFSPEKLFELLAAFRKYPREEAFERMLGMSEEDFEEAWRDSLKDRSWVTSRGAMDQKISLRPMDETEFLGPDVRGHIRLGDRLRQQDQMAAALVEYKKALEREPDNGVALLKTARVFLALGNESEAEEALRHAVKKNPAYVTPYAVLGGVLSEQGRYEEAQPVLEEGLEINPFHPELHRALGLIAVDIGHFSAARKSLELALRLNPNDSELREVLRRMPKESR